MSQPDQPEGQTDIAAMAAALYHRCYDELELPEELAVRIAGDFYQAMVQEASRSLWAEGEGLRWVLRKLGVRR